MFNHTIVMLAQEEAPPVLPQSIEPVTGSQPVAGTEQATTTQPPPPGAGPNGAGPPTPNPFGAGQLIFFIVIIALFWIFLTGSQRKEKKKHAAMLGALKKGDKVQTLGGILGTVIEVRDTEIVVKVDENSNARIKFARSAIQNVIEEAE